MDDNVNEITEDKESMVKRKGSATEGIERLLKCIFLISFISLVLSQALLTDPSVRAFFSKEASDGVPLENEAYLFEPCKMELKLNDIEYCPELKVMVNGDEVGDFSSDTLLLELKDGDIVELDASKLLISANVQISAVTSNIEELLGRSFTVTGGIVRIASV